MKRLSAAVAGLGAVLFAFWFASELQWFMRFVGEGFIGEGSGGIGAVSSGVVGEEPMMFAAALSPTGSSQHGLEHQGRSLAVSMSSTPLPL